VVKFTNKKGKNLFATRLKSSKEGINGIDESMFQELIQKVFTDCTNTYVEVKSGFEKNRIGLK
jgi:hypothetical protein